MQQFYSSFFTQALLNVSLITLTFAGDNHEYASSRFSVAAIGDGCFGFSGATGIE